MVNHTQNLSDIYVRVDQFQTMMLNGKIILWNDKYSAKYSKKYSDAEKVQRHARKC